MAERNPHSVEVTLKTKQIGVHMSKHLSETWAEIVKKAWQDEGFKRRAIANPAEVLKEHGYDVQHNVQYKVIEERNDGVHVHLSMPKKPGSKELEEKELKQISGGAAARAVNSKGGTKMM